MLWNHLSAEKLVCTYCNVAVTASTYHVTRHIKESAKHAVSATQPTGARVVKNKSRV